MKKRFFIISILIVMLIPMLCAAEAPMQFLKTPVIDIIKEYEMPAQELFKAEDLRALIAVALQISLMEQDKNSDGHIEPKSMWIGCNGDCFYLVSAYSESKRAIFELDTKYLICKYRIEDNADMSQNEMICKEICPDYYCALSQKEVESVLYGMMNK